MTSKIETSSQASSAFVGEHRRVIKTMAQVCREFGISRKIGYKWARRVQLEQSEDYADRSHEAHTHPNQVGEEVEQWLLKAKRKHPSWGPKKLVISRQRSRKSEVFPNSLTQAMGCNEVCCVDFKGWVKLGIRPERINPGKPYQNDSHERMQMRGEFKWEGKKVFLSEALAGEEVALIRKEDGKYLVNFHWLEVGIFDGKLMSLEAMHPQNRRRGNATPLRVTYPPGL